MVEGMTSNIIVEILKYGREKKPGKEMGFTRDNLKTHLKNLGFKMDYEDDQTTNIIFDNCFMSNVPGKGLYVMKADGYFTLLEYEELEEARASSKQANVWAIVALSVSIVGTLLSMALSIKQINGATEIKQNQIDQITNALNVQTRQIDSLIKVTRQSNALNFSMDTLRPKTKK
jgi:hypothetical protein